MVVNLYRLTVIIRGMYKRKRYKKMAEKYVNMALTGKALDTYIAARFDSCPQQQQPPMYQDDPTNKVGLYKRATAHDFREGLKRYYGDLNGWSYDGTKVMFEYLEEVADDQPIELDACAICCDYSESTVDDYITECHGSKFEWYAEVFGDLTASQEWDITEGDWSGLIESQDDFVRWIDKGETLIVRSI